MEGAGNIFTLNKLHKMNLFTVIQKNGLRAIINLDNITKIIEHADEPSRKARVSIYFIDSDYIQIETSIDDFAKRIYNSIQKHTNTNESQ